ncbi:MAG: hypothetical protein ACRD2J_09955 [Thermoanaerobaculia bacterium]
MHRALGFLLLLASACTTTGPAQKERTSGTSTFFATAEVETFSGHDTDSGGDLWPSCWADDGNLYTANGDGRGFGRKEDDADIVVSRVFGTPESGMTGEILSRGEAVANIWPSEGKYNRKPTGMLAIDGDGDGRDELYLAVQNLNAAPCPACFNDAPSASISRSTDYGKTWRKTDAPMFTDHRFTTMFFLDYGRSGENATVLGPEGAKYVYVYGLDYNWRSPTDPERPRPTDLYLARVPKDRVQERAAWEFYAGMGPGGEPLWSPDMQGRQAVLHDERTVYPVVACGGRPRDDVASNVGVISQGGVVYNAPLDRYVYSSWTWYTFEFYEAPTPWGPWRLFLRKDFGATPFFGESTDPECAGRNEGGYPTTIPSKFISADGKTMWVQSNTWERWNYACGSPNYKFSLRKLVVEPFAATKPENRPDPDANLARIGEGTTPIEKAARLGRVSWYNDGIASAAETSFDCDGTKTTDFWGYTWTRAYNLDRVVYTSGEIAGDGGWFETLRVQVRQNFRWVDVEGLSISPADLSQPYGKFVLDFDDTWGDGVRIIGMPGGSGRYTTLAELEVYYAAREGRN